MNKESIKDILKTEETPLYVFDLGALKHRIDYLRKRLPEKVDLCYAVKANPFIIRAIADQVEWLEICSPGELRICRQLGIPETKYVISGVYKNAEDMTSLISCKSNIGYYTAESTAQFNMLRETAKRFHSKISVLLRLTSGNQFGIEECDLSVIAESNQNDPWVDLCGIQYFSGTQKNSLKKLAREIAKIDDYLERLDRIYRYKVPKLEFGPGFPVTYFEGEAFDEDIFLSTFSNMLSRMLYDGSVTLEIGRSLAASCGTYLTRVVDMKQNHGEYYAIVDGGIHQLVYYGQSMAMKHPHFSLFPLRTEGEEKEWNICGSLCTTNDFLVKRAPVSGLQMGDVLAFEHTGAYCMTEGISLFLSRDLPEVVLLNENGTYSVVRKPTAVNKLNTPIYNNRRGINLWTKD